MVNCTSGDIFQAKLVKLLVDIQGFKTFIDDILFLIKDIFQDKYRILKLYLLVLEG